MEVDKKLYEEIKEYCKLNGIKPSEYVNSLLKEAFMKDKYGIAPFNRRDPYVGNRAFEEAVNAEIKRIMNDENELKKAISTDNRVENDTQTDSTKIDTLVERYKEDVAIWEDGDIHLDKNQDNVSKLEDKKVDLERKVVKKHTIKPIK